MIDKRYYEKLGGFTYLLGELRKKLGREQTDILVNGQYTHLYAVFRQAAP